MSQEDSLEPFPIFMPSSWQDDDVTGYPFRIPKLNHAKKVFPPTHASSHDPTPAIINPFEQANGEHERPHEARCFHFISLAISIL